MSHSFAEHAGIGRHDDLLPMCVEDIECQHCGNVWTAFYPIGCGSDKLECPKCGAFDSDYYEPERPVVH